MQILFGDSVAATADYRRRARRIRASFCKAPLLRQQALVDLAVERNAQTMHMPGQRLQPQPVVAEAITPVRQRTSTRRVPPTSQASITSTVEHRFADDAAERLQTFGFTFSDRVALLDLAERQGITRFRANMMLALLEHQAPARRSAPAEVPSKSVTPSLLMILGIELAIVCVLVMLTTL